MLIPKNFGTTWLIWKMKFLVRRARMSFIMDEKENLFKFSQDKEIVQVEISQNGYIIMMKYFKNKMNDKFEEFLNSCPSYIQDDYRKLNGY